VITKLGGSKQINFLNLSVEFRILAQIDSRDPMTSPLAIQTVEIRDPYNSMCSRKNVDDPSHPGPSITRRKHQYASIKRPNNATLLNWRSRPSRRCYRIQNRPLIEWKNRTIWTSKWPSLEIMREMFETIIIGHEFDLNTFNLNPTLVSSQDANVCSTVRLVGFFQIKIMSLNLKILTNISRILTEQWSENVIWIIWLSWKISDFVATKTLTSLSIRTCLSDIQLICHNFMKIHKKYPSHAIQICISNRFHN
jgi:hypothetical protein